MNTIFWHTEPREQLFEKLDTSERGLVAPEVERRLKEYGNNKLPESKSESYGAIFARQFQSPLIYILAVAAGVIYLMGEHVDAFIILGVLGVNAIIGTFQEGRAQNTLQALKRFTETRVTVLRDDKEEIIPDSEVVPGDILILSEGERVGADARLVDAQNLKADESSLTGESTPVEKNPWAKVDKKAPIAEQGNMVFKGTHLVGGTGRAIVVATGPNTFIGGIAQKMALIDSEIPLKADIRRLSHAIIGVVAVISGIIFLIGLSAGESIITMFKTVISLSVSIIPEGLPIVITLVLATGVWRMSKRNALVKRLQAVEALGQAQVIAVDKTGTLTRNEQIVQKVYAEGTYFDVTGTGYSPEGEIKKDGEVIDADAYPELVMAGKIAALGASARVVFSEKDKLWRVSGDPTEAALVVFAEKLGFRRANLEQQTPLLMEIPFDYRAKYHATLHDDTKKLLVVIGAPEEVLARSVSLKQGINTVPLIKERYAELERIYTDFSKEGLRVLAYATAELEEENVDPNKLPDLSFGGFFGMKDGLREEVAGAMLRSREAGVRVVMITGDHKVTAQTIAVEAGIYREGDEILTGNDIETISDEELVARLPNVSVFARVTPEHKLRIVELYKKSGQIIAMTGDGVNDAPSLVAADLGVSMGLVGTEVAKEASDIVLLDDNFGSIVSAIEEGRNIYKTIKKVILYLFSTSAGEVLTILGALLIGYPLPLLASQIIWLNFVTDPLLDVSLAMESKEKGLLSGGFRKPGRYLLDRLMVERMMVMSMPMMIGTLFLFSLYIEDDLTKALTVSLTALAVFQWFNAWNCRHETESFFKLGFFTNKYLIAATLTVIALQMLAIYSPFLQSILHTTPLSLSDWLLIVPVAFSIVVVEELRKFFHRKF